MPLGTEVGLGPSDIALDEDPAPPPQKGGGAPLLNFWPMSIVAKRLDGSRWDRGGPWSRPHCASWGPSYSPQKKRQSPLNFWPIFIVAKRLDASRCRWVWW